MWLLRATHNSAEVRRPGSKRKSVRATGRRLVRGSKLASESVDYWPGKKATSRPPVSFPAGEPCSEPGGSFQNAVALQSDLSAHTRVRDWSELSYPPPDSATDRLNGSKGPAPEFPLRASGSPQGTLQQLCGASDAYPRRDESFEMGRAPFGSEYCTVVRVGCPVGTPPCPGVPPPVACPPRSRDGSRVPQPCLRSGAHRVPYCGVRFVAGRDTGRGW